MHPNPAFRTGERAHDLAFARDRGFGILSVAGPDGVLASHIPFLISETGIEAHLVRSSPIARLLRSGDLDALLMVSGPDSYISPDWYQQDDQVPTWNYVAVHIRGRLGMVAPDGMRPHLERLSEHQEKLLDPKPRWTMDKNRPETLEKLMRQIVPVSLTIEVVDSTWKLNQNKRPEVRANAADALAQLGGQAPGTALSALMRGVDQDG